MFKREWLPNSVSLAGPSGLARQRSRTATANPPKGGIKFNLNRAIELLGDLNHEDMDITAPPSNRDFFKEREVAQLLHEYLDSLIDTGLFNDCDLRGKLCAFWAARARGPSECSS